MAEIYPSKKEFLRLAKSHNLIPVCQERLADTETPVSCFLKLKDQPYSYLLESVEGGEKIARYSFLGGSPSLVFESRKRDITITQNGRIKKFRTSHDPLYELEKLLGRYRQAELPGLPPFTGGAVGYFGYDNIRFIERVPDKNRSGADVPESLFIFTDTLLAFDHAQKKLKAICNVFLDQSKSPEQSYQEALLKIEALFERLREPALVSSSSRAGLSRAGKLKISSNFTREVFKKAVLKAKTYIKKGDIFQVVLSQIFSTKVKARPFDIYRQLRALNPSPYLFYLNGGSFSLAGSSPEIHVRCQEGHVSLRPIAGTRPRGQTAAQDMGLEQELLNDPKERAEHLMLVDLGRNDLGRVCEYRSVRVPEFMTVERYSHVMHIVSLVEGRLKKSKSLFDLLRATFPAGTVSGAPKVRAMEIIDELENRRRGVYSGVVGYFSYSGNLDSCIAIRTLLIKDGVAYAQAGAGIVADSDPDREYEETRNKANALLKAVEQAERGGDL